MNKVIVLVFVVMTLGDLLAQNVGIGTTNPKANFHIAGPGNVLMGDSLYGPGQRLMWIGSKSALRGGLLLGANSSNWNLDSIGLNSLAFGNNTKALSFGSVALGVLTSAKGEGSFAIGYSTTANGNGAACIGRQSSAIGDLGVLSFGYSTNAIGANGSIAMGYAAFSSGGYGSLAMGNGANSLGISGSVALGYNVNASGDRGALAMGYNSNATGDDGSIALGSNNQASGQSGSTVIGHLSSVSGDNGCTAIGKNNNVYGDNGSTVLGINCNNFGSNGATAIGESCITNGNLGATAIGYNCRATGSNGTMALGYFSRAIGTSSVAIGAENYALALESTAMGTSSIARGQSSFALGYRLVSKARAEMVVGTINDTLDVFSTPNPSLDVATDRLFTIGNGYDFSSGPVRRNAMVVLKNGNTGIGENKPSNLLQLKAISGFNDNMQLNIDENSTGFGRIGFSNTGALGWTLAAHRDNTASSSAMNFFSNQLNADVLSLRGDGSACFYGNVKANVVATCSDVRYKSNVKTIKDALKKVQAIDGVTYTYKVNEYADQHFPTQEQAGLIAQQVESVLPQVVYTDANGYKSVDYAKVVPLLVEAIKDLKKELGDVKKSNDLLLSSIEARLNVLEGRGQ